MKIRNIPISRKIALAFAVVLAVSLSTSATLYMFMRHVVQTEETAQEALRLLQDIDTAFDAIVEQGDHVHNYLMTVSDTSQKAYETSVKQFNDSVSHATQLAALHPDPEGLRKLIGTMQAAAESWRTNVPEQQLKLINDPTGYERALNLPITPPAMARMQSFRQALAAVRKEVRTWQTSAAMKKSSALDLAQQIQIGGAAGAAGIAALMALLLSMSIARPLRSITSSMNRLAEGDDSIEIPAADRRDEIGHMAKAVSVFKEGSIERRRLEVEAAETRKRLDDEQAQRERDAAEQQRQAEFAVRTLGEALDRLAQGDLVHRVDVPLYPAAEGLRLNLNTSVEKVQEAMIAIIETTRSINMGTGEISSSANDLSRRTEEQAASLEQTAAALEEITATVAKTSEGAQHASAITAAAQDDAQKSSQIVSRAIDAMGRIEKSSQEIGQIIGVIDEIAFQTNLLALNAGVEAARAGDAGKGFAVVASEVRGLAQRSAEAAKEIKNLISSSTSQVGEGVGLVRDTGKALERILVQVADVNRVVSEIASGAREQTTGLQEVNTAVNRMDQVTQQNAAMVEETAAASLNLRQEADSLMRLVGRFQVGAESAAPPAAAPRSTASAARPAAVVKAPAKAGISKAPVTRLPPAKSPLPRSGGGAPARTATAAALKPVSQVATDDWTEF
jgi:methyl-accepting chemotaxis protein